MNRSEMIKRISNDINVDRETCEAMLDSLAGVVVEAMNTDGRLVLKNFVTFELHERGEHKARNPQTGETELFPPVKYMKCKVSKAVKDALK